MNEPWISAGMTYRQCLEELINELERYDGEHISQSSDPKFEHPVHRAVRLVESFQEPDSERKGRMRFHLPNDIWPVWGQLLTACRGGKLCPGDEQHDPSGPMIQHVKANPELAKEMAGRLAEWASRELERLASGN